MPPIDEGQEPTNDPTNEPTNDPTNDPNQQPAGSNNQANEPSDDDSNEPESFDRQYVQSLRGEAAKHRKAARDAEKQLAAAQAKIKEFEDSQKSELERAQQRAEELEARATQAEQRAQATALRYEVALAATKHHLHDPEVAHKLLDASRIEYDEDGQPTNVDKLIKDLAKAHPYLVKGGAATAAIDPTPNGHKGGLTDEEIRKQAGARLSRSRL